MTAGGITGRAQRPAVWLLVAGIVAAQGMSLAQLTALNQRILQIEAGVEFWEYGQQGCTAPAPQNQQSPAKGGLAAFLPPGAV